MLLEGIDDLVLGAHDADVDDLEVVAAKHDGDNVFANVVHVTLDRGDEEHARLSALDVSPLGR